MVRRGYAHQPQPSRASGGATHCDAHPDEHFELISTTRTPATGTSRQSSAPADVFQDGDDWIVLLDLPGVQPDAIDVRAQRKVSPFRGAPSTQPRQPSHAQALGPSAAPLLTSVPIGADPSTAPTSAPSTTTASSSCVSRRPDHQPDAGSNWRRPRPSPWTYAFHSASRPADARPARCLFDRSGSGQSRTTRHLAHARMNWFRQWAPPGCSIRVLDLGARLQGALLTNGQVVVMSIVATPVCPPIGESNSAVSPCGPVRPKAT